MLPGLACALLVVNRNDCNFHVDLQMMWGEEMRPEEIFSHWKLVRRGLLTTMDNFREAELNFVPYEGGWSVGEILLHIANAEQGWFRYSVNREFDAWPSGHTLDHYPTFESIKALLTEVHDWTEKYISGLSPEDYQRVIALPWDEEIHLGWIIWHVLEHEIHHRGELSLILGLLGREGLDV
jgi:uncharacterized damage-inducible protein DinB